MKIKFTEEFIKDCERLFSTDFYYKILRFFDFIKRIPKEIKWLFQRIFKGYDERIYWDLYDYLGKEIIKHLKNFKNSKRHGVPSMLCTDKDGKELSDVEGEKLWNEIIDKMVLGFEEMMKDRIEKEPWQLFEKGKIDKEEWLKREEEDYKKAEENAMLFIKYFSGLWD